jgi:hypothetical protein
MEMLLDILLQFSVTPHAGFLARVPRDMRFYVEQFLAFGKLAELFARHPD